MLDKTCLPHQKRISFIKSGLKEGNIFLRKTILVVDDEEDIRTIIREILHNNFYTVLETSNGIEALKILAKQKVDLLITDIFMPEMSGVELAIKIKASHSQLKIIGITGGGKWITSDQVQNMSLNFFTSFLKKPFSSNALIKKVTFLLSLKGQ